MVLEMKHSNPPNMMVDFTHIDSVPEKDLHLYYAKAKILLFPSREDGFGLVLCQALYCGTLYQSVSQKLVDVSTKNTTRDILGNMRNDLSWAAFGRRYCVFLDSICKK